MSNKFSALTWRKKNKTCTPKAPEVAVTWRMTKKTPVGGTLVKNRGGLFVKER